MKKRMGFVSNSSSSSFAIYGALIDLDGIEEILTDEAIKILKDHYFNEIVEKDSKEYLEKIEPPASNDDEIYGIYRGEICDILKVSHTYCGEEGFYAIGKSFYSMNDDETKSQFKQRVEDEIKKFFKITKFDFHEGEYAC